MHDKVMGRTQTGFTKPVHLCTEYADCDLDLATCVLFTTHCLVMVIICADLFINPTMHGKVMCQTQTGFTEAYAQSLRADCDLDLQSSNMVSVWIYRHHDDHLYQIIYKSCHARLSYGSDTNRFH